MNSTFRSKSQLCWLLLSLFILNNHHFKAQQSYTFTNAGNTGSVGPTQAMVNAAYAATNLSTSVNVIAGIQSWTVPITGVYDIDTYGASGGDYLWFRQGGLGAKMQGQFNLLAGSVLQILVGQQGQNNCATGSGGGGTYVLCNGTLLMAAGGGGGCSMDANGVHGTTSTNGTMCFFNVIAGGTAGSGGQACITPTLFQGNGNGGGGYVPGPSGNGQSSFSVAMGGLSFLNGGTGGSVALANWSPGGFGGGGAAAACAVGGGGGGGYSGGAGGVTQSQCGNFGFRSSGGGGGSFNAGVNQVNAGGVNFGHGKAIVSLVCNSISLNSTSNPLCPGGSATLSTNAISNYSWSTGSNTFSTVVTPSVTSTYTVIGQSSLNCLSFNVLTLSVTSQPSVAFSPLTPTSCAGANLLLIANGVGGTAPYTATWVTAPAGNSYTVNYPAGVYTESVNITDANNCSAGASLAVNVIANPVVASNSVSLCQGAVATLSATGAATYTWLPSGFSGSSFTVSPPGTTQYTLSGTAVTGCTANAIVPAQVLPLAMLSFSTSTITCASLASATVSASGGTGPYSYTWLPGGQTNSVATGLIPNTYTLTVFDVGNGCTTSSISVFNSLVPLTGSLVNTPSLACNGASTGSAAVLNLSGGSGSQNYAWSNGVTTFTASSPGNLSAGQWSLSVTDALTACQVNSVFVITQAPAATLSIVASSPSLCAGTAVSFTANNAGGTPFAFGPAYTYTWSGGPVNSLYIATQTLTGIHIYTVNSSDANACVSSQTIAVNGVPNPTLTVSSVSICPQQTATLVASGASTYTWLPSLAIGASFTQALLSSTQYTVIGSALSCTAAATASISLKTLPQATLSSNAPLCNNQSLSLSALGGTAYVWSGPLGYGSSQQNPIINPVNPGQSGVYSLTLTGANSCTATAGVFVTVHATPTLSAIGSTLCSNQSVSLAAYSLPGATYAWLGPNGFSAATQVTVLAISAASLSGVYQVIATSAQGCSNTANANVTITAAPSVSITANNPLCVGSNLQLAGSGGVSYSWSGPGGFNATSQNPSILSVGLNHAGTYSLIATTGPCVLNALKTITVHPLPTPVANYNAPLCEGQPMQLQSTTATTYTWSGPQNFNNHNQNAVIGAASFSLAGTYSLAVSDANGCVAGTTLLVTVLQNPVAVVNSATVCAGGSASLTASGGLTYTWNGPNGFLATNPAVYFSQVLANQSGPYTVVVTGSNTCSSAAIAQLSVFNYAIPIPTIVATPSVCVNSNISLQASGGLSYAWAGPDGFVSTSNNISFVALHTGMTGTYTLSIVNSSYCVGSGTVFVKVFPLPNASLSSSKNNLCVPFCTEFKLTPAANSAPLQSYQYVVEGNFYSDQTLQYCIQRSGNNSAFVYFTDAQGCTNSSSLTITGYPKPKADFEFYPDKPLAGKDVVNFSNQSQGSGITNFMWVLSASDSVETEQTTFLFEDAGQYPVVLCVKNDWACADTIIKVVPVFEDFAMYIPNAFTPNNDGLNDVFKVISMGLKEFSIEIYNHWGTKVFATNDTQEGWNGEFNGTVAQLGVYNWRLTCVTTGGKRIDKTGYVLLEK